MKQSNYNIFVHYKNDDVFLGYNSVSGGLYIFNPQQYDEVRQILAAPTDEVFQGSVIKEKLIKGRFLVDSDIDELELNFNISRVGTQCEIGYKCAKGTVITN